MGFQRGQTRPASAGRRRGVPNKATAKREAEVGASGLTPLEYMLSVLRDETVPRPERMDAASKAAPYVHSRLAAIEHSGKDGGPLMIYLSAADKVL